jgi:hypothetical protein
LLPLYGPAKGLTKTLRAKAYPESVVDNQELVARSAITRNETLSSGFPVVESGRFEVIKRAGRNGATDYETREPINMMRFDPELQCLTNNEGKVNVAQWLGAFKTGNLYV